MADYRASRQSRGASEREIITGLRPCQRALVLETPRRRGRTTHRATRDAISAASRYGVDIGLVRSALERSPAERLEMLEANVAFVRAMKRAAK